MRVRTKFFILAALVLLFLGAGFAILGLGEKHKLSILFREQAAEEGRTFNKLIDMRSESLKAFAYDYTFWDEMVDFISTEDVGWAQENIDPSLSTYKANTVWVFRDDFSLLYQAGSLKGEGKGFPLAKEDIKKIFAKDNRFSNFFIGSPQGLVEVWAATVHPTADVQRKTAPAGYFFCARLWSSEYIKELSELTSATISLAPSDGEEAFLAGSRLRGGIIYFSRVLKGWNGLPVARLNAWYDSQTVRLFSEAMITGIAMIVFFAVFVAGISLFFIRRWITLPLASISGALKSEDPFAIGRITYAKDEFGDLARLLHNFLVQREALKKEMAERKRMEEQIKREKETAQRYLDVAGILLIVINADEKVSLINKKGCEVLECQENEIIGKNWFDNFILESERGKIRDVFRKVISGHGQEVEYFENLVLTGTGKKKLIGWHNSIIRDGQGKIIAGLSSGEDITNRRKAEEELRCAYESLKEAQVQLVQSSKMAAVGQLASGVAHEINNPLTGVLNNVQLVRMEIEQGKELSAEEFKEMLGVIEDAALRCRKITQSLLDFSHASAGKFQSVSLNEVAEKVFSLVSHEIKLDNIKLEKQLQPDVPRIFGDFQLLQQVIFNLISNAKWAIAKKPAKLGGAITLKTEYQLENKKVCLFVSDTGVGIAKENFSKLFVPFFTTKDVGEGTGLGLSIIYNIIREHKGTIDVESELGKGTTFKIALPVSEGN